MAQEKIKLTGNSLTFCFYFKQRVHAILRESENSHVAKIFKAAYFSVLLTLVNVRVTEMFESQSVCMLVLFYFMLYNLFFSRVKTLWW